MGKPKNKFGKITVVSKETTDLETFNAKEEAQNKSQVQPSKPASTLTKVQADFAKACENIEEGELQKFYYLDNKVIEAYYHKDSEHALSKKEIQETLDQDVFLFNIRQIVAELNHILDLPYAKFWAQMTRSTKIVQFLDTLLQNIRKVNDTYKLCAIATSKQPRQESSMMSMMMQQANPDDDVKEHIDQLLSTVFAIYCRMSLNSESEECQFPTLQYQQLVYENYLFDIAKLYDLAAVYGPSNPQAVTKLISNVFENDLRYVQEFKDSVDTIITCLKKCFNAALKVTEMTCGDSILNRTQAEQDDIIRRLLLDLCEILTHLELTTRYFPEIMLETVRNTSLPLFMGNVFSLMIGPAKKLWLKQSSNFNELEIIRRSLKKLAVESCLTILDVAIVRHVGVHAKNYAVLQNLLGQNIKQFIFGVTGNIELSKDSLHKNQNYLVENSAGQKFLKKIINHQSSGKYTVDLVTAIQTLDERFLDQSEKQFLLMILKSLSQGLTVNVQIKSSQAPKVVSKQESALLNVQDKENIKQICDMFSGQFTKQRIESIYLENEKNLERTLDLFLNGRVSNEEEQIVVQVIPKFVQIDTRANTAQLQAYVMDQYKDVLFPKKQSKFAKQASIDHQKALSQTIHDDDESDKLVRQKILKLAELMQYDDDIEESQVQSKVIRREVERKPIESKGEEDDEDDLNDPEFFIERQNSVADGAADYMFQDDQKQGQRKVQQVQQEEKKNESQQKGESKQDGGKGFRDQNTNQQRRDGQREVNRQEQRPQTNLRPEQQKFVPKTQKDEAGGQPESQFDNIYKSSRGGHGAKPYVQKEDGMDRGDYGKPRGRGDGRGQDNRQKGVDPYQKPRGGSGQDNDRPQTGNRGGYGRNEDRQQYSGNRGNDRPPNENRPQYSGNRGNDRPPNEDRPQYSGNRGNDRPPNEDRPQYSGNRGKDRPPYQGNRGGNPQYSGSHGGNDHGDSHRQVTDRGGNRGSRGSNPTATRGGYREDFQREVVDSDKDYTTKNPLEQKANEDGGYSDDEAGDASRGSRGGYRGGNRGRGVQNRRGGAHNQKNQADKKYASNF